MILVYDCIGEFYEPTRPCIRYLTKLYGRHQIVQWYIVGDCLYVITKFNGYNFSSDTRLKELRKALGKVLKNERETDKMQKWRWKK